MLPSTEGREDRGFTMGFDFVIPHRKDDLLNKSGINHYVVDEVLPLRILPGLLQEFKQKLRASAGTAIISSFDAFYSVLINMGNASSDMKELTLDLIVKAITGLTAQLTDVLERDSESALSRQDNLNAVKMSAYIASQLVEAYETEALRPSATEVTAAGKGRKGKKAAAATAAMGFDWDAEKERALTALSHLMQLPLQRLWDPPVADQEFVNMVTSCCYKLLENPATVRNKGCRDAIFHLLGTAAKRYNHSLGASLKIVQLLQHFEHLSSPLAQLVAQMAAELGVKGVVGEVLREVGRMDVHDLSMDSSGTRCICEFLVELAQLVPDNVLPTMSVLVPFLDEEQSYPMRNAVLGMMGEILVRALTKEDLEQKLRSARDHILDRLEDHVHDVNAYVRSRALQIWLTVVNEKAVPLQRQLHVVDLVIGRLHDKSCQARKYAIQLMTALIKTNPYAANLSIEALATSLEKEHAKLAEMQPSASESGVGSGAALSLLPDEEAEWSALEPGLRDAAKKLLAVEAAGADRPAAAESELPSGASTVADDDTATSVADKILSLARSKQFEDAVRLLMAAKEAFPGLGIAHSLEHSNADTSIMDDDDENELPIADTITRGTDSLVLELKHLFAAAAAECQRQQVAGLLPDGGVPATDDGATAPGPADDISRQRVLVGYLKDCLAFAKKTQAAIPIICQLLGSKMNSDVMEAIDFFVTSYEFGVVHAMAGITKMLSLVWSREQAVKDAVVGAYKRIYVESAAGSGQQAGSDDGRLPASRGGCVKGSARAVSNLIALVLSATIGDLTSLEELVAELVRRGDMAASLLQSLWQRFTMKVPGTTPEESRASLILLGMAASADVDIVRSNVDVLITDGLGDRALTDFWLARDTCSVLLKLAGNDKPKAGQYAEQLRFPHEHQMFTRLIEVLVSGFPDLQQTGWVPLSEQAANVIYRLSENPDETCGLLIKRLAGVLVSSDPHSVGMLTRLVSLSGHVAFRQLIHLDVAIFGELKRRLAITVEKQNPKEKKAGNTTANMSRLSIASRRSVAATPKKDTCEAVEEELGLTGAAAEDAEMEYIRKITEQDTVSGSSLMGVLAPLIVKICSSPAKYSDPALQAAASLALAKFMLISSEFCDHHLQLLFTVLERSENVVIRSNTIVALGDLTFRFPNLIEPWTPNLYARLRDPSAAVRKSTTMVLSHLILNDMVKVKGQISEMAMCTVDVDERIAALAKVFFSELAKKGNTVYNIMPDVISRLSDEAAGTTEENFRSVMKFLFSFIEKERQCETIIEKLCLRFRATRSERQWRDLAFCLSLLSYSEKGVRKLQEHFACFGDKLGVDEVHECFLTIVAGARKLAKVEAKAAIDELEQRIEECHLKGAEDEAAARKADGVAKKAAGRSTAAAAGSRSCARRRQSSALTQRSNNADGTSPATPPGTVDRGKRTRQGTAAAGRKSTAKKGPAASMGGTGKRRGRQPRLELSSSEADDDFQEAAVAAKGKAAPKKPVGATPSRKRRVNPPLPTFSDEDEEDDDDENGEDTIAGWRAEESADQSRIEADLVEEAENVSPTALLRSASTNKSSKAATKAKAPPPEKSGGPKAIASAGASAAAGQRRKR